LKSLHNGDEDGGGFTHATGGFTHATLSLLGRPHASSQTGQTWRRIALASGATRDFCFALRGFCFALRGFCFRADDHRLAASPLA
jgi:hypothetical protein